MPQRRSRQALGLAAAILAASALSGAAAGAAGAATVYNNIPSPLPGNLASFGNEAYSNSEFGGQVEASATGAKHQTVTVAMSSWACQYGQVYPDTCETTKPTKKFKWPITLNIYEVGPGNTVGPKIGTATKKFAMPYRPTRSDAVCVPKGYAAGTWYDAATNACYHGLAFTISFKLNLEVRKREIISLSYNTSDHGPAPVGPMACNTTVAGCFYDSLNVAVTEPSENALTVGGDPTRELYLATTYGLGYCGSSTPLGTFGPTAPVEGACAANEYYGTEAGIQPSISVVGS